MGERIGLLYLLKRQMLQLSNRCRGEALQLPDRDLFDRPLEPINGENVQLEAIFEPWKSLKTTVNYTNVVFTDFAAFGVSFATSVGRMPIGQRISEFALERRARRPSKRCRSCCRHR